MKVHTFVRNHSIYGAFDFIEQETYRGYSQIENFVLNITATFVGSGYIVAKS